MSVGYFRSAEFQKDLLDRVAASHTVDMKSSVMTSCLGLGSAEFPLSVDRLQAFQEEHQMTSLKQMCP